jgi:hypothetical protein
MKTGLIIKVLKNKAIVLSDGQFLDLIKRNGMLRGQEILFTQSDIYISDSKTSFSNYKKIVAIAASLIILLSVGLTMDFDTPASIVIVDINPSIKLKVDEDEIVVDYKALNKDGKELDLVDLKGMTIGDAVEYITEAAINSGYLNTEDLEDDFILITTISDEHEEDILKDLEKAREESETLKGVNMALTSAEEDDLDPEEDQDIPLGLLALDLDGLLEIKSVRQYFSDNDLVDEFLQKGFIIEEDVEHELNRVINNLENSEIDDDLKDAILDSFRNSKDDFDDARTAFKEAKEAYKLAKESGNHEEIDAAELALSLAQQAKDEQEQIKDSVELVKDLLLNELENDSTEEEFEKLKEELEEKNK